MPQCRIDSETNQILLHSEVADAENVAKERNMFRWLLNRFRKKEKSRTLKIHPPNIVKTDEMTSNFKFHKDGGNRRDSPLNHIYEEIDEPASSPKGKKYAKKNGGKKVHFMETRCRSVSDISQVPIESPMPETHRRSSSLVSIDDYSYCDRPSPSSPESPRLQPVKPPRKNRPSTTRRWHTMLEKPDKRPLIMRQRESYERNKSGRSRFCISRQGDYCLEPTDSDSGYENSNCSSTGSDVIDFSPVSGYEYYLSKIEQLRILEEEVDDLMIDLDMSETHKLINSRLASPRMGRHCFRSPELDRHLFESRRQKFSRLPDPSDYSFMVRNGGHSRSCESLCRNWASYENTLDLHRDDFFQEKLAEFKARYAISDHHLRSSTPDRCGHLFPRGEPEMSSQRNHGYRKPVSGATVSRHHTVGGADASRTMLPNKTLRELIRDNNHKQYVTAKM